MVMTETTFSEFVTFINTHPQWRHKLAKALFPDIDVAKAFQNLAESQRQMQQILQEMTDRMGHAEGNIELLKEDVSVLKEDVSVLKEDVSVLKEDVSVLKKDMTQVKRDIGHLKGFNYESRIINRAASIFGRYMRRGHDARNEIGLLLEEAENEGLITEQEHDHVLSLDLLWRGKQKHTKIDIILTVEVSWWAEETDITRSLNRAKTLQKIGLTAFPIVAGWEWSEEMMALARQQNVMVMTNITIEEKDWLA